MKSKLLIYALPVLLVVTLLYGYGIQDDPNINDLSSTSEYLQASHDNLPVVAKAIGDSCFGTGQEKHDDGSFENGIGWSTAVTDGSFVLKFRPAVYPWKYTKFCVGLTKLAAGVDSLKFDVAIYDSTGPGGTPGNVLGTLTNQVARPIPIFPLFQWFSYDISAIAGNVVNSGAIYIGIKFDASLANQSSKFAIYDQSTTTPLWPGYAKNGVNPWQRIDSVSTTFAAYRCFAMRTIGVPSATTVQNHALRLPTPGANTNYVSIPHQPSMVGFSNVTIEAWVNPGGSTTANTILNKGAASFDYQLGISATTTIPFFRAQGIIATASTMTITPNIWTHLAVTYDGTTVKFYKNGVLGFSLAQAMPLGNSTGEMRIGRGNNDAGSGNIEELRLWSVARTQGQIDTNKCKKYPSSFGNVTGLKAAWHFDSTYTDSVSNYNGIPLGNVGFDTVSYPVPGANCILVGIQNYSNQIPNVYRLDQNYPNPFNPVTTIKFGIPKGSFVEIKIFDILGKEIQTIFSDPLDAGKYSINFNAQSLPSGIYFYKITAGEFVDSKKMILLK